MISEDDRQAEIEMINQLTKAILDLHPKGLSQLIDFLEMDGAMETISDDNIRSINLMRDGVEFKGKYFFDGRYTMGRHVATVLRMAKSQNLGVERTLSELVDNQKTLDKNDDDENASKDV